MKHWKLLLYFRLQLTILLLTLTFNLKCSPLLLWLTLKLRQIIFSSIPFYVSFFSPPPLKVARGFSFCVLSSVPCSLARARDVGRTVASGVKSRELSERKCREEQIAWGLKSVHSADGVFGTVYKEAPPFFNLISPEIHERRRRISSGVSFRDLGKVFFFLRRLHGTEHQPLSRKSSRAVGQLVLQECRMTRDPSFIDRKSIRPYGKSRSVTRTCLPWARAPTDPCGK